MDAQIKLLTWLYESHEEELPFSTSQIYEKYQEEEDYDKSKPNLSELLGKLKDRGLLESPSHGQHQLTDRGKNKAESVLNPESFEGKRPEGFTELVDELEFYLFDEKKNQVYQRLVDGRDFKLKLSELEKFRPELIDKLEENPEKFIEALTLAKDEHEEEADLNIDLVFDVSHFDVDIYQALSALNVGELVTVEGTVSYSTSPIHEIVSAVFECEDCGDRLEKEQDSNQLKDPYKCDCGSRDFELVEKEIIDVIELDLSNTKQEDHNIKAVFKPEGLDERVRQSFSPGNKLRVSGVVKDEAVGEKSSKSKPFLDVISYQNKEKNLNSGDIDKEVKEEVKERVQEIDGSGRHPFEAFSNSLAPEIQGSEKSNVKQIVATSLIEGYNSRKDEIENIHGLIAGNPGEGKSAIVEWCSDRFEKFLTADGTNSTGVGLTGSVEKEETGGYRLKAGKLVYADKGVLGIDEVQALDRGELDPLRKAMQEGYFTLDKATQHAKLPGRASVVATGNYSEEVDVDHSMPLHDFIPNFGDDGAIRDRFNLVYCIEPGEDRDAAREATKQKWVKDGSSFDSEFDEQELKVFRHLAKQVKPDVTSQAANFIEKWINGQETVAEQKGNRQFKNTSARFTENLFALSTVMARARLSDTVERRDAEKACELFLKCKRSQGLGDGELASSVQEVEA